jgi:3-oxoacid CoA-transferase A subunit
MRLGGIYSPIGIGTTIENGKEKRVINGVEYVFEEPIIPDLGLVSAVRADRLGNLVYHGTARAANPIIAMASRYTVAEVFEIVESGELDPDTIVTPAAFVDRVVLIPEDDPSSRERRREWLRARREHQLRRVIVAEADAARGDKS